MIKRGIFQGKRSQGIRKASFIILWGFLGMLCLPGRVWARESIHQENRGEEVGTQLQERKDQGMDTEYQEVDTSLLEEVDFSQVDWILRKQEKAADFSFTELVKMLIDGEEIDKKWLAEELIYTAFDEVIQSRHYLVQILLLAAAFALLYHFSNVFENAPAADISFYMVYMILLALLMNSFLILNDILNEAMQLILDFMRALLPAYCLTVMFSTGSTTTVGFYQLIMFLIYLVEQLLMYVVIPAVRIYIMLELLNHLTKEELISKITGLVKGGIEWVLKALFTLVIGINVVQGLLAPVIDGFKSSAFARTAGMLPGVGGSVQAVAEIMVGSGIIIKNAVGVAGIIVLLLLGAGPLLKVGIMALLYKLTAAVIQPIADQRFSGCVNGVGEGARLLGKVLLTANVMFLITIALVTAATTWNR